MLAIVCHHLPYVDVCHLLTALSGQSAQITCRADVFALLPVEVRETWLSETACNTLEARLRDLAEVAAYHSRPGMRIHAYADWTLFSLRRHQPYCPAPVAEYAWEDGPRLVVHVNSALVKLHVEQCLKGDMCAARVSFYPVTSQEHGSMLLPVEVFATQVQFYPHYLLGGADAPWTRVHADQITRPKPLPPPLPPPLSCPRARRRSRRRSRRRRRCA